jgi:hypothetical protein
LGLCSTATTTAAAGVGAEWLGGAGGCVLPEPLPLPVLSRVPPAVCGLQCSLCVCPGAPPCSLRSAVPPVRVSWSPPCSPAACSAPCAVCAACQVKRLLCMRRTPVGSACVSWCVRPTARPVRTDVRFSGTLFYRGGGPEGGGGRRRTTQQKWISPSPCSPVCPCGL